MPDWILSLGHCRSALQRGVNISSKGRLCLYARRKIKAKALTKEESFWRAISDNWLDCVAAVVMMMLLRSNNDAIFFCLTSTTQKGPSFVLRQQLTSLLLLQQNTDSSSSNAPQKTSHRSVCECECTRWRLVDGSLASSSPGSSLILIFFSPLSTIRTCCKVPNNRMMSSSSLQATHCLSLSVRSLLTAQNQQQQQPRGISFVAAF